MKEDWIQCKAEDFGELIRGITYNKNQASDIPKDNYLPLLRANNINDNKLNFDDIKYVEESLIDDFQKIIPNDILIAMSSGSKHLVGKSAQSKGHYEGSFGAFCAVFRPNQNLSGNYVSYFFQSNDFRKNISEISKGSNINNLKREHILDFVFPIAPLPIQRAIVSKIEALFSDLDNGIANFKKAQEQLKIYRQAVLKKAFEGELTNSSHKDWEYLTLKECVKFSQGIQVDVNLQNENKFKNSVRFLRIIDFTQGNDPARYIDNPCEKYIVSKDDVSLVRYGASTGFVCSNLEGAIANNLFRVIPTKDIEKKYLFYFLSSPLFQNIISQSVKGAAMPAISFGLINDVLFPFPKDMAEQTQVVQEIESRLSVCDKMEQSITESIEKAEALRQSILKKAFEGKLLSQAEIELCKQAADYEPASELLKKIQAEKLAKEQEMKKKPTVKKKSKK